ncbi:DUF6326 family protein [Algibacter pacificus]|uniref:DUF6326 family protein n=1 Tax=Algibacter pacificus TaxID=2599389 RepID=UPI0011C73AC7|nr:DUF6326 family protein [Algibacter pacificus]
MEKNILSKLWTLLTVNYIFCDLFSLYDSVFLNKLLYGNAGGIEFSESFLLGVSMLMEIPMLMIVITLILKNKAFKIVNISISAIMVIVQTGSLITGVNTKHYLFFSFIEISILFWIIYLVSKYKYVKTTIPSNRSTNL